MKIHVLSERPFVAVTVPDDSPDATHELMRNGSDYTWRLLEPKGEDLNP